VIGAMWRRWRVQRDLRKMTGNLSMYEQALIVIRTIETHPELRQSMRRALAISVKGTRKKAAERAR
jgi:hypothetical protein